MGWRGAALVLVLGSGCSLFVGGDDSACAAFDAVHFDACELPDPSLGLELTAEGVYEYDTTARELRLDGEPLADQPASISFKQPNDVDLVVISVDSFRNTRQLNVVGTHPLAIAVWTSASIEAPIVASSSTADGTVGAGAAPEVCNVAAGTGMAGEGSGMTAAGGGGGGFQGTGGSGGAGPMNNPRQSDPGQAVLVPTLVRGGCAGGTGGVISDQSDPSPGGQPGGAVQISARTEIRVESFVEANGGGGTVNGFTGGGGGGSGGYIGFDAPSIDVGVDAGLFANGGGGGGGGAASAAVSAEVGQDGARTEPGGLGGAGANSNAGVGGDGGKGSNIDGQNGRSVVDGSMFGGGGGGGGGVGYILFFGSPPTIASGAVISPAPHCNRQSCP